MVGMQAIKRTGVIAMLAGISVVIALTIWSGGRLVGEAMASVGAGTLLVVLARAMTVSIAGVGWWLLFPPALRPSMSQCVHIRFIREATNNLLPLAQVGGDFIGARLLTFGGMSGAVAVASVIVDVLLQAATQFLFAICGLALLISLERDNGLVWAAVPGFLVAAAALGGFYVAQRRGGQRLLRSVLDRFTHAWIERAHTTVDTIYDSLARFYDSRSRFLVSTAVHFVGWIVGAAEVYFALEWMGHPVTWAEAVVIESLIDAVRGAAFAVPAALGAQEGGLIVLCALFGIPPDQALALSLVKRVADLAIGLPGLLAWQLAEGARLRATARGNSRRPDAVDTPPLGP
jgi:putative membrane protein